MAFGEIYAEDNTTATTVTNTDEWYRVTIFDTNGQVNGVTADHTNDHLITTTVGKYMVNGSMAILSAGAAKTLHLQLMTNTKRGKVADSENAGGRLFNCFRQYIQ